jgi:hypothetical protein
MMAYPGQTHGFTPRLVPPLEDDRGFPEPPREGANILAAIA